MTRAAMWALLAVVAGAAAVLSFSALRDLALLCGFDRSLAWLLPLVVDCGAAAGCVVWLSRSSRGEDLRRTSSPREDVLRPQRFARSLTWLLLTSSVVGNALVHGLSAYHLQPAWWVVVIVSAVAPSVLGATVHLAVVVGRPDGVSDQVLMLDGRPGAVGGANAGPDDLESLKTAGAHGASDADVRLGRRRLARELGVSEHRARQLLAERNGAAS